MKQIPFWRQLSELTWQEVEAQIEEDLRRLRSGEIDDDAGKRVAAYELVGQYFLRLSRLAEAAGCPDGTPAMPWLIEHGFVVDTGDDILFTEKATTRAIK
jgi:hypothetical protein